MYRATAHVRSERGLHARPSAAVVKEAGKYVSEIHITNPENGIVANAKVVLQVMALCAPQKTALYVEANGSDAEEAAKNVARVIDEFYIQDEEV